MLIPFLKFRKSDKDKGESARAESTAA